MKYKIYSALGNCEHKIYSILTHSLWISILKRCFVSVCVCSISQKLSVSVCVSRGKFEHGLYMWQWQKVKTSREQCLYVCTVRNIFGTRDHTCTDERSLGLCWILCQLMLHQQKNIGFSSKRSRSRFTSHSASLAHTSITYCYSLKLFSISCSLSTQFELLQLVSRHKSYHKSTLNILSSCLVPSDIQL